MMDMKLYDVHCHVLPGIDDGCATVEESLEVLIESSRQNIAMIAATPHYYPNESITQFLKRRRTAAQKLIEALDTKRIPRPGILLGAEVAYHVGLVHEENLTSLCIGKTSYLLLELPFKKWSASVLRDIQTMRNTRGIIPIIAHLERFFPYQDKKTIQELLEMDVLVQMNAEYILDPRTKRNAKKLLKQDVIQLLGSDCHNTTSRPQQLEQAFMQLKKWGMSDIAAEICQNSSFVFMNK